MNTETIYFPQEYVERLYAKYGVVDKFSRALAYSILSRTCDVNGKSFREKMEMLKRAKKSLDEIYSS